MTAKEYMQQARHITREMEEDRERLARLWSRLTSPGGQRTDGMPRGGRGQDRERMMAQYADLKAAVERKNGERLREMDGIRRAMERVADSRLRRLLKMRYLDGWGWRRIARTMHYSEDHMWTLHREALRELERVREQDASK